MNLSQNIFLMILIMEFKINIFFLAQIKLPLSKNNCLTIEKLHIVNNDEIFFFKFFENLKKNQKDFKTTIII